MIPMYGYGLLQLFYDWIIKHIIAAILNFYDVELII